MAHKVIWEKKGVIIECNGIFTSDDMLITGNQFYGDSRYESMRYQIVDLSNIDSFDMTIKDAKVFGMMDKTSAVWNNNMKMAFVTTNEKLIELLKEYQKTLIGTNWKVDFFENFEEARIWTA